MQFTRASLFQISFKTMLFSVFADNVNRHADYIILQELNENLEIKKTFCMLWLTTRTVSCHFRILNFVGIEPVT